MDSWFWYSGIFFKRFYTPYHVLAKPTVGVSDFLCLLVDSTTLTFAGQRAGVGQGTI